MEIDLSALYGWLKVPLSPLELFSQWVLLPDPVLADRGLLAARGPARHDHRPLDERAPLGRAHRRDVVVGVEAGHLHGEGGKEGEGEELVFAAAPSR